VENKKYYAIRIVSKSNKKIVERAKSIHLTHIYMTTHFPGLVQVLQEKVMGLS